MTVPASALIPVACPILPSAVAAVGPGVRMADGSTPAIVPAALATG